MARTSLVHYISPSAISIIPNCNDSADDLAVQIATGTKIRVYSKAVGIDMVNATYAEWTLKGRNRRLLPAGNQDTNRRYTIFARLSKQNVADGYVIFTPMTEEEQEDGTTVGIDKYWHVTTDGYSRREDNKLDEDFDPDDPSLPDEQRDYWFIRIGWVTAPENNLRSVYLDTGILGTEEGNESSLDQLAKKFVTIDFFKRLFTIHGTDATPSDGGEYAGIGDGTGSIGDGTGSGEPTIVTYYDEFGNPVYEEEQGGGGGDGEYAPREIEPNDMDHEITDIQLMFGTWTEHWLSALGMGSGAGGGGGDALDWPLLDINYAGLPQPGETGGPQAGDTIVYDPSAQGGFSWGKTGGGLEGLHLFDGDTEILPQAVGDELYFTLSNNFLSLTSDTTQVVISDVDMMGDLCLLREPVSDFDAVSDSLVLNFGETKSYFSGKYVTVEFFESLFELHMGDTQNTKIDTNADLSGYTAQQLAQFNIKAMFGTWTEHYLSALGMGSTGGGGGTPLNEPLQSINGIDRNPRTTGQTLVWKGTGNGINHTGWDYGTAGMDESALAQYLNEHNYLNQSVLNQLSWWGAQLSGNQVKGDMINVGSITPETNNASDIGTTQLRYKAIYVNEIHIGQAVISWDSTNNGVHLTKGAYTDEWLSALGAGSQGSSGGTPLNQPLQSINAIDRNPSAGQNGYTLVWNGSSWGFGTAGMNTSELSTYLSNNGYLTDTQLKSGYTWWGQHLDANGAVKGSITDCTSIDTLMYFLFPDSTNQNHQVKITTASDQSTDFINPTKKSTYQRGSDTFTPRLFVNGHLGVNGEVWMTGIDFAGASDHGGHIDFNYGGGTDYDYSLKIIESAEGVLTIKKHGTANTDVTGLIIGNNAANGGRHGDYIKIGGATIKWDNTNQALHIDKGVYSDTFVSALGMGSGGTSGGGINLSDVFEAYRTSNSSNEQKIDNSHLKFNISNYATTHDLNTAIQSCVAPVDIGTLTINGETWNPYSDGNKTITISLGLGNLTNVNISSPTDGQVLKYDASTSKWVNGAGGGSTYTLPAATSGALGGIKIGFTKDTTNKKYPVELSSQQAFVQVPWANDDTKNTAGTTNKTGTKMFLVGATEQSANPQTYSNSNCYIGSDNMLYSDSSKVLNAKNAMNYCLGLQSYDSTPSGAIIIDTSVNVNNIRAAGTYCCKSAAGIIGQPARGNYRLWHIVNTGTDDNKNQSSVQIALFTNNAKMYMRNHTYSGTTETWGSWVEIATSANAVMLSGNQTVGGTKTFSDTLTAGTISGVNSLNVNESGTVNLGKNGTLTVNADMSAMVITGKSINNTGADITIQTSGSNKLQLGGSSNNVGIGASADGTYKLKVTGTSYFTDDVHIADGKYLYLQGVASDSSKVYMLGNARHQLSIYAASIYFNGVSIHSSDIRLKDVHENLNIDVEDIARAPIFNFSWKKNPEYGWQLGSSAQYWQNVFRYGTDVSDEGYLGMDYGATALAAAVMTARKVLTHEEEIDDLKRRLSSVELENQQLRHEIEILKAA